MKTVITFLSDTDGQPYDVVYLERHCGTDALWQQFYGHHRNGRAIMPTAEECGTAWAFTQQIVERLKKQNITFQGAADVSSAPGKGEAPSLPSLPSVKEPEAISPIESVKRLIRNEATKSLQRSIQNELF